MAPFFLMNCRDEPTPDVLNTVPDIVPEEEILKIPVVVHVVNYSPAPFEVSDEKIASQLDVLNQDYRKKNTDWSNTPTEFMDLVSDVGIEFFLAEVDPDGNPTTGITRISSEVTGWEGRRLDECDVIEELTLYFTEKGGSTAWPRDQYLNIWIADLSDRNGNLALAGYANEPGCDERIDGVVMDPRVFGILPPLAVAHQLGRTATHEIGHWLGLRHIFGKAGVCEDDPDDGDLISDTPTQQSMYLGKPTHPSLSCGSNDMFMNFMDLVDDEAMFMFTAGQRKRMRSLFNEGESRRDLYLTIRTNSN
ncbi:MAG: M43 family zinc metalloprotease [Bacteroidota bacterium]